MSIENPKLTFTLKIEQSRLLLPPKPSLKKTIDKPRSSASLAYRPCLAMTYFHVKRTYPFPYLLTQVLYDRRC